MKSIEKLSKKYAKQIRDAGFTHIKVELEAQLDRENRTERLHDCENCTGNGIVSLQDPAGNTYRNTCVSCGGRGGEEIRHLFDDEDYCEDFLKAQVSDLDFNYINFYNDGSVDSELTFTIPVENMHRVIDVIKAWNALAEANGNGMNVDGAGMHISVLQSSNYPSRDEFPSDKWNNFHSEVTKLLPSLLLLGTSSSRTRPLRQYRSPQVSDYHKYSSIYAKNRASIEYRLFDTCYDKPQVFMEYMGAIAKTLEFFKDPTKKVASVGASYSYHEPRYETKTFVDTEEKLKVIKGTLKHVKPDELTIKELSETRGVSLSVVELRKKQGARLKRITELYDEYKKNQENLLTKEANEHEKNSIKYYRDNGLLTELSDKEILLTLRDIPTIEDKKSYIDRNLFSNRSTITTVAV